MYNRFCVWREINMHLIHVLFISKWYWICMESSNANNNGVIPYYWQFNERAVWKCYRIVFVSFCYGYRFGICWFTWWHPNALWLYSFGHWEKPSPTFRNEQQTIEIWISHSDRWEVSNFEQMLLFGYWYFWNFPIKVENTLNFIWWMYA